MKGITILGSPRINGNTNLVLKQVTLGLQQNCDFKLKQLKISDLKINPCTSCEYCKHNQGCIIDDDMDYIYNLFNTADLILIAAPLYFNTVPAQLKALIDRCQALWANRCVLTDPLINPAKKRLGAFIGTSGQPLTQDRFKYIKGTIDLFFKSTSTHYYDNFLVGNTDKIPVAEQSQLLKNAKSWGHKLVQQLINK